MKALPFLFALIVSATSAFADEPSNPHQNIKPANPHGPGGSIQIPLTQSGKVLSSIDVPTYTYIEVSQGKEKLWLAALTTKVKKGDTVQFDEGMVMDNFHSKSLNRTFPKIVFVNKLVVDNGKK
jgi:hypothetical protein